MVCADCLPDVIYTQPFVRLIVMELYPYPFDNTSIPLPLFEMSLFRYNLIHQLEINPLLVTVSKMKTLNDGPQKCIYYKFQTMQALLQFHQI
jgi:hypothetical protein